MLEKQGLFDNFRPISEKKIKFLRKQDRMYSDPKACNG